MCGPIAMRAGAVRRDNDRTNFHRREPHSMPKTRLLLPALATASLTLLAAAGAHAAAPLSASEIEALASEVSAAEIAFAKTMADRRLDQFTDFVAEDAVFVGASMSIGRARVIERWGGLFKGPQAPFSWAPDAVAAAADGRTAISTGQARDPAGKVVSRFTSIWRKDADGHWRVIVDQGVDACDCPVEKK